MVWEGEASYPGQNICLHTFPFLFRTCEVPIVVQWTETLQYR